MLPLENCGSASGSSMGRPNAIRNREARIEFMVRPLRWIDGGYDEGGAYWGRSGGDFIYRAEGESETDIERIFIRAANLDAARAEILKTYPNATFHPDCELEEMLSVYIDTALKVSLNDRYEANPAEESEFLDGTSRAISPDTESIMRADCEAFLDKNRDVISLAAARGDYSFGRAGRDFWLTRNGHGAGFLDMGTEEIWWHLDKAARAFPEEDLGIATDGLIRLDSEDLGLTTPGL